MNDATLFDSPITAVQCTPDGTVYFAAASAVFRSSLATASDTCTSHTFSSALPYTTTSKCASTPPSTVITALAIAPCQRQCVTKAQTDAREEASVIVFVGAADRLLAQIIPAAKEGSEGAVHKSTLASSARSATAERRGCCCALQTAESRILRIAVDAVRRAAVVLTASNRVFFLQLDHVEDALRAEATPLCQDVSQTVRHVQVRGPSLGVVLAADILVEKSAAARPAEAADEVPLSFYRFFAATYSGEVVEWCHTETSPRVVPADAASESRETSASAEVFCVASRVQAHPSGCAIFSVRVEHCAPPSCEKGEFYVEKAHRTHLVTCSDDRTVALYERRRCVEAVRAGGSATPIRRETEWVLLWRGVGASFSKGRIFDVAVRAVWCSESLPPSPFDTTTPSPSSSRWSCAAHVAAAGEDGGVQVIRIQSPHQLKGQPDDEAGTTASINVTPCFVRARQHRGHGAYRLDFCESATGQMTLVSGGFDGIVFAHSYPTAQLGAAGSKNRSALLDTSSEASTMPPLLARSSLPTAELLSEPPSLSAPTKSAQVRVVHVDAAGNVLACTSEQLIVQFCGAAEAGTNAAHRWQALLPSALNSGNDGGNVPSCYLASPALTASECGLPTCVESLNTSFFSTSDMANREDGSVSASFAVIGTTTGILYAIPYACSRPDGRTTQSSVVLSNLAQRDEKGKIRYPSIMATTDVVQHGKVTQLAVLDFSDKTGAATDHQSFLVAASHVRHVVVLSALHISLEGGAAAVRKAATNTAIQLSCRWQHLSVFDGCPGPLTTVLSLIPSGAIGASGLAFWLLVGDRNGCLLGEHRSILSRKQDGAVPGEASLLQFCTSAAASEASAAPYQAVLCTITAAPLHEYVFPEHQHIAIAAICVEESTTAANADDAWEGHNDAPNRSVVLRIAGTGGVLAFLCLSSLLFDETTAPSLKDVVQGTPRPASCREPLRLPFEVSSILTMSSNICVAQSGTTVSVLYRIPGQASWVLVDAFEDVRAPRLLTARIQPAKHSTGNRTAVASGPVVFLAHCSDGHTVDAFASFPDQQYHQPSAGWCVRTSLLHGGGFPGKDYNCVAYAPAPLNCLLLGNEDSSLVVVACPPSAQLPLNDKRVSQPSSLLRRVLAPVNICGAHHSNILSIVVLPRNATSTSEHLLRVVSVGGGAMVNLWNFDNTYSPLRLEDWWCAGSAAQAAETDKGGTTPHGAAQRTGCARFQKKRVKQALASSAVVLTERIARFMCVAALGTHSFAVGSSDGTLLLFRVRDSAGHAAAGETIQLEWQGPLHLERPKPILCVSTATSSASGMCDSAKEEGSVLLVAGDTNGFVYVFDVATRRVLAQRRLEQSSVNALSEVHPVLASPTLEETHAVTRRSWRFASLHDSGNVYLVQVEAVFSSMSTHDVVADTQLSVLSSASTGLTAGRSVRWPQASLPVVAVTEERITHFDPQALSRDELSVASERRVNVRCVSGAAVVDDASAFSSLAEDADCNSSCSSLRVAVVGQGFEIV